MSGRRSTALATASRPVRASPQTTHPASPSRNRAHTLAHDVVVIGDEDTHWRHGTPVSSKCMLGFLEEVEISLVECGETLARHVVRG